MIGYYVHHQGKGHINRALAISMHIDEPVIFFSSLPRPSALRPNDVWVRLSADVPTCYESAHDVTANGRLHWAPIHVAGLARRSAELLQKLAATRPRRLVVDVSVETALLARLAGVPVILVAQPGDRADDAHQLGYGIAERIIACWTAMLYEPPWLAAHAQRTHLVGAISRFDGFERPPVRESRPSGLLLAGAGGTAVPTDALSQLRRALPQYDWNAAGGSARWVDDLWPMLASADLVVTHAGQSALADVAVSGAAAIVIPEDRPFGEQRAMADALDLAGAAVVVPSWPDASRWPTLANRARSCGRDRWEIMGTGGAAERAAAVIAA